MFFWSPSIKWNENEINKETANRQEGAHTSVVLIWVYFMRDEENEA